VTDRDSAARSRAFYRALGATGLAIRTKPEWDAQIVDTVVSLLPQSGRVLDAGCGYGRIAIPLAERGYEVTGLDVSPNLLRSARRDAAERGLRIPFDEASMTAMPYPAGTFEAVICLWSAFWELLVEDEQVAALREMRRVLVTGGAGIVEGPTYTAPTDDEIGTGARSGPGYRIAGEIIAGHRNEQFAHDASTLRAVCNAAGIADRDISEQPWAGRTRLILRFRR
jgi:SAM-dependent methyltransferase